MDLQSLANLGEFIGGVVVVVSLAYLALQVRQSTRAQLTQNYGRALERLSYFQSNMSQSSDFSDLLFLGMTDPERLTPQQRIRFAWVFYELFGTYEFMYHQAVDGGLPPKVWARWHDTIVWWLLYPGVQAWWDARPTPFTADFSAYVDRQRMHGVADEAAQQRWTRFLHGARAVRREPVAVAGGEAPG